MATCGATARATYGGLGMAPVKQHADLVLQALIAAM